MLLGNYSVHNRNPIRHLGGGTATPECSMQFVTLRQGARKNRQYVMQTTAANKQFSLPYGNYPPSITLLPQVGGDLSSRRNADFSFSPVGSMLSGKALTTTPPEPSFGFDTTATGGLIATVPPGGAPATFGISDTGLLAAFLNGDGTATFGMTDSGTMFADGFLTTGTCTFGFSGDLTSHAIGIMSGTTAESGVTIDNIVNGVWDAVLSEHLDAGTTGAALSASGSAGDPWITTLPGSYVAGSAGYILGNSDPQGIADAVTSDPKTLTVAKFLGLK
jgi:hypothetical protein